MKTCIKPISDWLSHHPRARQWAWFVLLWYGGVMAAMAIAYPIKMLIRLAG